MLLLIPNQGPLFKLKINGDTKILLFDSVTTFCLRSVRMFEGVTKNLKAD